MFKRMSNLVKGFLSLFVSSVERSNPEALLEVEKENLRKNIAQYNTGLASHAGICEKLMTQTKKLEAEERDLRAKTAAHLKAGNQAAAGQYALRLQVVVRDLAETRTQLEGAEATYKDLTTARDVAITTAKSKVESLKGAIQDMRMKSAIAEMSEMASGMISTIGGSGDTLNRLQEMVEDERNKAAGRARMARDSMDLSQVKVQEHEQEALAAQALADFAAKEGIAIAPIAATVPSSIKKEMGPLPVDTEFLNTEKKVEA